ncbi:MAG: Wadjet anti-phage system protein JetD domain-containing protein [Culicoidibacterales bacterium]
MDFITKYPKRKITLAEIESEKSQLSYLELYRYIQKQIDLGRLEPVKASKLNGKNPMLHLSYWIKKTNQNPHNEAMLRDELQYQLVPQLSISYYLANLSTYQKDREAVLALNRFLLHHQSELTNAISTNERSFQIFGHEKFLVSEGVSILKNLGLSIQDLIVYETAEPIAYYTVHKTSGQKVLIIENKDTFYSLRQHLSSGEATIFGEAFGTIIYGGGKRVVKEFRHFQQSVETYLTASDNQFYYFGDLDYEGIVIFESLAAHFPCQPFVVAYERMLVKAQGIQLPKTKRGQNRQISDLFFDFFSDVIKTEFRQILQADDYIPQEIVTKNDF